MNPIAKALAIAMRKTDRNPSEAQKAAGNYAKGKVTIHGLDISIENPKNSTRRGVDPSGKTWEVKMPAHYGYITRVRSSDGKASQG